MTGGDEMNDGKIGRLNFFATILVLLALMSAAVLFVNDRLHRLDRQALALQQDLASTQQDLGDSRAQVQILKGTVAQAGKDLQQVDKSVQKQAAERLDTKAVTKQALPSVVTVLCGDSLGTGFAVDVGRPPVGFRTAVITNYHVVEQCSFEGPPEPTIRQGDASPATILTNWDAVNDLALLYVDLDVPTLATAPSPEQGDPVVAIGSPYGLADSVTTGIVSQIYDDFFQTDATINPGNSGGPLLDRHGKVLGVTTFKLGDQGTNFAVRMRVTCNELLRC